MKQLIITLYDIVFQLSYIILGLIGAYKYHGTPYGFIIWLLACIAHYAYNIHKEKRS